MKKDYVPVPDNVSDLSEVAFVEQLWTQVWNDTHFANYIESNIETSDEFKIIKPYLENLPVNSRILDGGCGRGEWTNYLVSIGFDVIGLDICQMLIDSLRQKFPENNFKAGDIRRTEFLDNSYDLMIAWGTFEHFEDGFAGPLREARRILKDGAYLFISIPYQNIRHLIRDKWALWFWDENYDKHFGYRKKMRFYQWRLSKQELQREFEINGFKTIAIKPIKQKHGIYRLVKHDLHIDPISLIGKAVRFSLHMMMPKNFTAHMIIGIAQKV